MPATPDHSEDWAKQARQEAAIAEQKVKVLFDIGPAAPDSHEGAIDRAEHDQIDDRNREQEEARHQGANDSANLPDCINAMLQR